MNGFLKIAVVLIDNPLSIWDRQSSNHLQNNHCRVDFQYTLEILSTKVN